MTYHGLASKYARGTKLNMVALRAVATEPLAVQTGKNIVDSLDLGFVLHGADDMHETRAVTITGAKAILTECWIGRAYGVNNKFSPHVTTKPIATKLVRFNLTRSAGTWRVSAFTDGAACAAIGEKQ